MSKLDVLTVRLGVCVLSVSLSGGCASQPPVKTTSALTSGGAAGLAAQIDSEISHFMAATRVPAFAYGVINRETEIARAFGTLDVGPNSRNATPKTIFHLASLSKPIVAASVMHLVERGALSLDDPVVKHLPYFKVNDPRSSTITIKQLLTHTSGLPDVTGYGWENPEYDEGALERYVRSIVDVKLLAAPGEKVAYSNMGYEVLGDVIAKAGGVSFEQYVSRNIFEPLGMSASTFLLKDVPESQLARPYLISNQKISPAPYFPYNRAHAPSSTLYSSASEMLSWLKLFLRKPTGPLPLSGHSISVMLQDAAARNVHSEEDIHPFQGLGWSSLTIDGVRLYGHGGHDDGFRSFIIFSPRDQTGLVMMTNGDSDAVDLDGLGLSILGKLTGRDWSRFTKK